MSNLCVQKQWFKIRLVPFATAGRCCNCTISHAKHVSCLIGEVESNLYDW